MLNKRAINLKKKLAKGEFSCGVWIEIPSPTACEIIAGAGLDWVIVDTEHNPFTLEILLYTLLAFKGSDTVPLVRVPWNDHVIIKQVLDLGFDGIVVPQTNCLKDVKLAVQACRYPPMGKRGFGPLRAGNYSRDQDEYVRLANEATFCVIQVEDVAAAEQIDEMVKVPGIDGIFVGRCDMSGTTEHFLDTDSPQVWTAVRKIFNAARGAGIPAGGALCGVENIEKNLKMNCQLVELGSDSVFLKEATDNAVRAFRETIKKGKDYVC